MHHQSSEQIHCIENPREEEESVEVANVVVIDQHLKQLPTRCKGQNDTSNRHQHVLRQTADPVEDTTVPCVICYTALLSTLHPCKSLQMCICYHFDSNNSALRNRRVD